MSYKHLLLKRKGRKEKWLRNSNENSHLFAALQLIFEELDKSVQQIIPTLNQRLYAGKRELQFRYFDNTITGDHFLILLRNLRFHIKANLREFRIDCKLEQMLSKNSNWTTINSEADDIVITTDGTHGWLSQNVKREAVTIDQMSQRLLSTIVRAGGKLPPHQTAYVLRQ